MRILNHDEEPRETSSRGKLTLLVIVALILGGAAYWFFSGEEETPKETPKAASKTPAPEGTEPREKSRDTTALLEISANVDGAAVFVDGERVGETPFRAREIEPGRHQIKLEKPGFETYEREVRVSPGRPARIRAKLQPQLAAIRIESDVPGSSVFVDRRYVGTTPLTVKGLSPGSHDLTVSAEGYDIYAETLEVSTSARDIYVRFKEVKLQESVDVVHKHGLGSCKGRLLATVDGLRYETSHKDAFAVSFASVERFEVDFIKKNLRVKVRGGRNYNFTEQSGNADALLVFHKNVDAAKRRLSDD